MRNAILLTLIGVVLVSIITIAAAHASPVEAPPELAASSEPRPPAHRDTHICCAPMMENSQSLRMIWSSRTLCLMFMCSRSLNMIGKNWSGGSGWRITRSLPP